MCPALIAPKPLTAFLAAVSLRAWVRSFRNALKNDVLGPFLPRLRLRPYLGPSALFSAFSARATMRTIPAAISSQIRLTGKEGPGAACAEAFDSSVFVHFRGSLLSNQ